MLALAAPAPKNFLLLIARSSNLHMPPPFVLRRRRVRDGRHLLQGQGWEENTVLNEY
jgi:hypothetical protein